MAELARFPLEQTNYEGKLVAGKFRIDRLLGEGGMGVVYAAMHLDLQKPVAIKIIRDELIPRDDVIERMLNEARVAAQLRSDHVAQVLDLGRLETGAPFIVMEYLQGNDLATCLQESGRLAPELAVSYLLQACEAVAEAHAFRIIHRDLKPDNLFVASRADGEPIVKILDFGISKDISVARTATLRNPNLLIGSPQYMSPEAMRVGSKVEPATDIWSLGAVLYELLTGVQPFHADSVPEVCLRVLHDEPRPICEVCPDVSLELAEIVHRCLRKDPRERWQDVAELSRALAPHGPAGSVDLAERTARIACGVRLKPRSAATPVEPISHHLPEEELSIPRRPRRWTTVLAVAAIGAGALFAWRALDATPSAADAATATPKPPAPPVPHSSDESRPDTARAEPPISLETSSAADAPTERSETPARAPSKPAARTRQRSPASKAARGKPAPVTSRSEAPDATPPPPAAPPVQTGPWDPDGFGGRK